MLMVPAGLTGRPVIRPVVMSVSGLLHGDMRGMRTCMHSAETRFEPGHEYHGESRHECDNSHCAVMLRLNRRRQNATLFYYRN